MVVLRVQLGRVQRVGLLQDEWRDGLADGRGPLRVAAARKLFLNDRLQVRYVHFTVQGAAQQTRDERPVGVLVYEVHEGA